MDSKRLAKFCEGAREFYEKEREARETPIPRITIRELKTLLDGYCDTCPYLGDADHHCEQNCAIPRIHADLDRFTDKCVEEGMKPLRWKIETQGAVPTGLAWKFTNENTGCVRHGDD